MLTGSDRTRTRRFVDTRTVSPSIRSTPPVMWNLAHQRSARLSIDSAVVDGSYANREGQLKQLQIAGADVNVTGSGTIALNDTGSSNLTLHADTPSLDRVGELIGQSLKGAVVVDATVTGNARELKADGTLTGSNVGRGDSEALSLKSTFSAAVPDLQIERPAFRPTARRRSWKSAARRSTSSPPIPRSSDVVTLAITARLQGHREGRSASAGGRWLGRHPSGPSRDSHRRSGVADRNKLNGGRQPAPPLPFNTAKDRIEVENVQLVNGDQRITADGVIAGPDSTLRVHADNVDVAQLDTLLLGDGTAWPAASPATRRFPASTRAPNVDVELHAVAGRVPHVQVRGADRNGRLHARTAWRWTFVCSRRPRRGSRRRASRRSRLFQPTPPGWIAHDETRVGGVVDIQIASSPIDLGTHSRVHAVRDECHGHTAGERARHWNRLRPACRRRDRDAAAARLRFPSWARATPASTPASI